MSYVSWHNRPKTVHKPDNVRDMVREVIAEGDGKEGWLHLMWQVHKRLGGENWPDQATEGQIRRAADALWNKGELLKVKRGHMGPDGKTDRRESVYYTPQAYILAGKGYEQVLRERENIQARFAAVYDRLLDMGLHPGTPGSRGDPVTLSVDDWEKLLEMIK